MVQYSGSIVNNYSPNWRRIVDTTHVEKLANQNITFGIQSDTRSHFVSIRLLGGE